ncbi:hypothetical protein L3Q72_00710 [Vibrio sp. JC009]|uniref:helix-turn-helix transcriptional regulator n=1 Tax=Vibrio sp. JC009 TaxID=2912314 RepID=UPI0023B17CDB|nr:hypothetical protein [Vibrio sp. JC009]WED21971.1 hypothetical protein L3Q72_00710 [Vibrio sp. JC009]
MKMYEFTLNIGNISICSDEDLLNVSATIYEQIDEDTFVGSIDEAMFIEFEREAESLESAIIRAIRDVESIKGYELVVASVEGDLVSLGEAAAITGVKKPTLSKYRKGLFGGGGFPAPARKIAKKDPLWRLWDIAEWLYAKGKVSESTVTSAKTISLVNNALEVRKYQSDKEYSHIIAAL